MRSDTNIIFLKIINFIFLLVILTTPFIIINYDVIYLKNNIPEQSLTEYTQDIIIRLFHFICLFRHDSSIYIGVVPFLLLVFLAVC